MTGLLSIFDFFLSEFFDRELPAFSNLPNNFRALDVNLAVGLFLLLVVLSTALAAYRHAIPGQIPRELYERQILSPENAATLSDLSVKQTWYLRFSLHAPLSGVRRCVRMIGETLPDVRKRTRAERREDRRAKRETREKNPFLALKKYFFPDLSDAKFYLDPARTEEVERRYRGDGVSRKALIWTAAGSLILFLLLCRLMPNILSLIDGMIG